MADSPSSRTIKRFKKLGYLVANVEKVVPHHFIKQDMFGFIDLVAIRKGEIVGIQATSTQNMNKRLDKSKALPACRVWLEAGAKFVVIGWSKMGERGKQKRWTAQLEYVSLSHLPVSYPRSMKDGRKD